MKVRSPGRRGAPASWLSSGYKGEREGRTGVHAGCSGDAEDKGWVGRKWERKREGTERGAIRSSVRQERIDARWEEVIRTRNVKRGVGAELTVGVALFQFVRLNQAGLSLSWTCECYRRCC